MRKKPTGKAKIIAASHNDPNLVPAIYNMIIEENREPQWQWLKLSFSYPVVSSYTVIYKARINS